MLATLEDHPTPELQTLFDPHSELGRAIDSIWDRLLLLGTLVFVLVEIALLYVVFRYRRRPTDTGKPPQTHGNVALEILWTLIPAFILLFIAVPTVRVIFETQDRAIPGALEIEVIGHQWWWEARYENVDPSLQVTTANELHIPVGRRVGKPGIGQDAIGVAQENIIIVGERVQRVIKRIEPHDSEERYSKLGVECLKGKARITTPWSVDVDLGEFSLERVGREFDEIHEQLFTFALDADHELVNLRAVVLGREATVTAEQIPSGDADPSAAATGTTTVYVDDGDATATLYDRALLQAGNRIAGPAIVTEMDSTTLILPGHSGEVDRFGNILIRPTEEA